MGLFDNIGRGALGWSTGGISELFQDSPFGLSTKGGKYAYPDPKVLQTPEQMEALGQLMAFAKSGKFGNFTAGEAYKGPLGEYDMTEYEKAGLGKLSSLLSGTSESFGLGEAELKKLMTTGAYDPNNDGGVYSGLTAGIDYNTQKAMDAVKHAGAYSGNLFSTGVGRNLGDVAIQGANQKSGILANLMQDFANKKYGAIPLAFQAGMNKQAMGIDAINASQTFGALPRTLADTKAKEAYGEWGRARQESLLPLQTFASIYSKNPQWHQPTPTVETPSPWNRLLDTAINVGATGLGYYFGGPAGGMIGNKIGSSVSTSGAPQFNPNIGTWKDQYMRYQP